jgi:cytochrome c556
MTSKYSKFVGGEAQAARRVRARYGRTFMMNRVATLIALGTGAILGTGTIVAYAQNQDAITQRRTVMKNIATAGTPPFKMTRGEEAFDLAKVQAGLKTYQAEAAKLKNLFPDNSKTGETDAKPKIWSARAEFNAAIDTFIATARTAAGAIKDEATFKAEYPKVIRSCGGCHKDSDGFAPRLADSFKKLK